MAMLTIGKIPGKKDINNQYSRASIKKSHQYYKKISDPVTGDYKFGELTNMWYPGTSWMMDVGAYPKGAQDEIKKFVIEALNNKTNGQDDPIPFVITWIKDNSVMQAITRSYDPFTITILNYPEPAASALDERKQKE
jgi:hypothetical protein